VLYGYEVWGSAAPTQLNEVEAFDRKALEDITKDCEKLHYGKKPYSTELNQTGDRYKRAKLLYATSEGATNPEVAKLGKQDPTQVKKSQHNYGTTKL